MKPWLKRLRDRCGYSIAQSFEHLRHKGGIIEGAPGVQHGFLDRGSSILAVAHLDYVDNPWQFQRLSGKNGGAYVFCPRLDDRLGVFTILDVLPTMGIILDVLFTENEEHGQSTANDFKPSKEYNWIVSFDRRGDDAVTYDYDWPEVGEFFDVGIGSFSDICSLEGVGVKALNVGVGYHREHTPLCYLDTNEYYTQLQTFKEFYETHGRTRFKHVPQPKYTTEDWGRWWAERQRNREWLDWWEDKPGGYSFGADEPPHG